MSGPNRVEASHGRNLTQSEPKRVTGADRRLLHFCGKEILAFKEKRLTSGQRSVEAHTGARHDIAVALLESIFTFRERRGSIWLKEESPLRASEREVREESEASDQRLRGRGVGGRNQC